MISFAKIVSIIFHPAILILLLPFLIVYRQTENSLYAVKWQMFSSLFVFLAGFLVLLGERRGIFSDSDLSKRKERGRFYVMVIVLLTFYILIVVLLKGLLIAPVFIGFGALFGVLIFTMLNHFFKISVHTGASCAFVITVGILYGINAFFAVIWILPLIIWARLKLKEHTLWEAVSGATLGGLITIVTYFIGKSFFINYVESQISF